METRKFIWNLFLLIISGTITFVCIRETYLDRSISHWVISAIQCIITLILAVNIQYELNKEKK